MQVSLLAMCVSAAKESSLQAGRIVEGVKDAIGVLLPQVQAESMDLRTIMKCYGVRSQT